MRKLRADKARLNGATPLQGKPTRLKTSECPAGFSEQVAGLDRKRRLVP